MGANPSMPLVQQLLHVICYTGYNPHAHFRSGVGLHLLMYKVKVIVRDDSNFQGTIGREVQLFLIKLCILSMKPLLFSRLQLTSE